MAICTPLRTLVSLSAVCFLCAPSMSTVKEVVNDVSADPAAE